MKAKAKIQERHELMKTKETTERKSWRRNCPEHPLRKRPFQPLLDYHLIF